MRWQDLRRAPISTDGLRPSCSDTGVVTVTTGKTAIETSLPKDLTRDDQGCGYIRVACFTAACFFALGPVAKGTVPSASNMLYLPADTPMTMRIDSTDLTFLHVMSAAPGTLQIVALK